MTTPKNKDGHEWYMSAFLLGGAPERVDRENGVIYGVAIVTEGEAKGHRVNLDSEFVANTVRMGNEKQQGLKARFGHPTMSSTALGTFIGRFKSFRTDGAIARADLLLSDTAKETPQGDLYDYVLSMAEEEPDMFGTSIVFKPGKAYRREQDGSKTYVEDRTSGETKTFIEIESLQGADVVDEPAANASGLFSAWNETTIAGQVSEFLDTHPDVLAVVERHPEVIEQFMAQYEAYRARMSTNTKAKEGATTMTEEQLKAEAEALKLAAKDALEAKVTAASDAAYDEGKAVGVTEGHAAAVTELKVEQAKLTTKQAEMAAEIERLSGEVESSKQETEEARSSLAESTAKLAKLLPGLGAPPIKEIQQSGWLNAIKAKQEKGMAYNDAFDACSKEFPALLVEFRTSK